MIDTIPVGPEGPPGSPGSPGEVSLSDLEAAIATTANNPFGLIPLSLTISDPPTQNELEEVVNKLNEMISALVRT